MKFIADGMLGKLTRWLRILGHDVKYSIVLDDANLIATAESEKRVLLTRDLELYKQASAKNIDAFYLDPGTGEEHLAELAGRFGIDLDIDLVISRCPKCNAKLRPTTKEQAIDKVEKSTLNHYNEFRKCSKCSQIYWQGSHWTKMRKTLENARKKTAGSRAMV